MKEVIKLIETHVRERRLDAHQGLNAVLDFLVDIFDVRHYLTENGWFEAVSKAEKEEPYLYKVMLIWMDKVATSMENGSWLDFFGGVYEEMYQSRGKASTLGQFYTPPELSDLLARTVNIRNEGKKEYATDCACGSGRLLLAHFAENKNYNCQYYANDIDIASVKMCALNFMIHGMRGCVTNANTLYNPYLYDYGFEINEIRYPFITPFYSLRRIKNTKEMQEAMNEDIRRLYGDDNVCVNQYVGCDVVMPKKGARPRCNKSLFKNSNIKEETNNERRVEPIQLDLFK